MAQLSSSSKIYGLTLSIVSYKSCENVNGILEPLQLKMILEAIFELVLFCDHQLIDLSYYPIIVHGPRYSVLNVTKAISCLGLPGIQEDHSIIVHRLQLALSNVSKESCEPIPVAAT